MSPSYFAVQIERINRECEAARLAGDIPTMQKLLSEQTSLMRAMYGQPQ
ncbi:hypothetical protein [Bradyrhizobium diazoefficiens]|nr:hypothetical protein [Bradyrhizobium diazoefficiens]WLB34993.1 hypothetical protein QIH78_26275 [Bradyrhizobium diazoefficiens]WLC20009.1 hypothetical protein QIH76_17380 [Bradyrhizobium diazoefficiens]